jgi:ABC-2 type transport system permease protein
MNPLAGTGKLARLILRRDRFLLPLWILLLGSIPTVYVSATRELYSTEEGLREYYQSIISNPSLNAIAPAFAPNLGALVAWRAGVLYVFVGVVSLLTVIRHTRSEEDAGRRELLGATVVGRHAPLAAALGVTIAADIVLGLITTLAMTGSDLPAVSSLAFGLSLAGAGAVFAAAGAVAAQLTESAGAARGIAISVLGGAFLLRAAGDSGGPDSGSVFLSWLSPIGWAQRVRPYAGERWWVFALLAALLLALVAAAAALLARRDVGAGMLPRRLGRAAASPALRSPFALAWRLHRTLLLGWTAGLAVVGLVVGGASRNVDDLAKGGPELQEMLERLGQTTTLREAYLNASLGFIALIAAAYATQATLRLRAEESSLRAEPVLATAVDRRSWMASHLVFAAVGPAVALIAMGFTAGVSSATGDDVAGQIGEVVGGALVHVPAVWVLGGLTAALIGLLPRSATAIAWGAVTGCIVLSFLGPILQLDQWLLDISPFIHTPKVLGGTASFTPLAWLTVIAAVTTLAGLAGFRRRDIVSSA